MRKYEISCAIIIQNMAQLETMYKESWKTIVGNCDEFIYLGGHESSSTEYVSKMLGKQTIKSRNSSRTYGRQGSNNVSLNATGRELMTPDEIAHMSDQDCLVMIKGVMPFFDNKYDLTAHPNYKYTGDADDSLLYNVAEEIRTPNNKLSSTNRDTQYRQLQREAKHDSRNHDRAQIIGNMRRSTTDFSKENLENAGFNNCYPLNAGIDEEEPVAPPAEVVGSHVPLDEFAMDEESVATSHDNLDHFLFGSGAGEVENKPAEGSRPNHQAGVVCYHLVTTGTDVGTDEILQVSVIDGNGNVLLHSFVKPRNTNWIEIEKYTGISPEAVEDAPVISELVDDIQSVLSDAKVRVSYNGAANREFLTAAGVSFPITGRDVDLNTEFSHVCGEWDTEQETFVPQDLATCARYYQYEYQTQGCLEEAKATLYCYQQMEKQKEDGPIEKA